MAKMKTDERTATAADRVPKVLNDGAASEHDIACRAYDCYLARDRADGHDVEDWLQAERELRTTPRSTAV
jgi:hypothetical protein